MTDLMDLSMNRGFIWWFLFAGHQALLVWTLAGALVADYILLILTFHLAALLEDLATLVRVLSSHRSAIRSEADWRKTYGKDGVLRASLSEAIFLMDNLAAAFGPVRISLTISYWKIANLH